MDAVQAGIGAMVGIHGSCARADVAAPAGLVEQDRALLALLRALQSCGYAFVTTTPASHARVLARPGRRIARNVADVLGWSLPFARDALPAEILNLLELADVLEARPDGLLRSTVRVSSLHGNLYLHSAHPTDAEDAVFFGPDSYRFADLIALELGHAPPRPNARIVDIGTGAGVGAIVAATHCPSAEVTMTDINAQALRLARVNGAAAGIRTRPVLGEGLAGFGEPIDVALANPPYIIDGKGRAYRDGGGMHGAEVALDMAREAAPMLAPGGRLILYTGSAIVAGEDALKEALARMSAEQCCALRYREIDPDVFGEELEQPAYRDVDRIALIGAVITRSA